MRINFLGQLVEEPEIRVEYIGCGSHSFRNILPTFQFAPVELAAVCDIQYEKARVYAKKFGAPKAYRDYKEMLEKEKLDAVFIVLGYNESGRPMYSPIAIDCLNAGCHVWMEKPGAAFVKEVEALKQAAAANNKMVMVGYKNMFAPVNRKAKAIISGHEFGNVTMALLEKSYLIPTVEEFRTYLDRQETVPAVVDFIDHLCHPLSTLLMLFGAPTSVSYVTNAFSGGIATFTFSSGMIGTIAFTYPVPHNGGDERILIVSDRGK